MPDRPSGQPLENRGKERGLVVVVCFVLAAIVLIVFGKTVQYEFVNYDDDQYVYENPRIANGLSLNAVRSAFTRFHAENWHPLTTISHQIDCQIYHLRSGGHHLTNVFLHALAAVILFLALRQMTGRLWPSAFVAAIFALHPLRVSSVAWVSERKDVLSGVFFALTLLAYSSYVRTNRVSRYVLVPALFALGLMCKPTLVTLPFVLLLLDYWPLQRFANSRDDDEHSISRPTAPRSLRYLLVEKIPLFLLSAGSCVVTLFAQERTVIAMRQFGLGDRLANAAVSYVIYLWQVFWPAHLAVVYPYPEGGRTVAQAFLALLVLLIISVACYIRRDAYPFLLVGWLWFLGTLVPMIGLIQVGIQARADRYTYLSQIGLYLAMTWGALVLADKWRLGRKTLMVLALLVVTTLAAASWRETGFWRNSETLWNHTLANTSNNYIAENNLGDTLMKKEGRLDEAILHLRKSLQISPEYPDANNNLGFALGTKGEWNEAIVLFEKAIRVRPHFPQAHSNLGVSLSKLGRNDEAFAELREAVRLNDDYRDAHRNLAVLLLQLGHRDEAIFQFEEALRLKPDDMPVREQLRQLGVEK